VTAQETPFRFYGRRKGKALRRRHSGLIEDLLPKFAFEASRLDAVKPRWLEIGFGGGEHLAHQAALHPDIEMIGAEAFINGVAKLLSLIDEKALENIRIHFGDARDLLAALPDACLDRIYLLYPDPWPKARHNKRRFVNQASLAEFHRLLKPGGAFIFASDIEDYVQWTLAEIAAFGKFEEHGDRAEPPENWIPTRYEAKARREGRGSAYLKFVPRAR
jgi:tRNA (guanine-N7-)-methyltransferase